MTPATPAFPDSPPPDPPWLWAIAAGVALALVIAGVVALLSGCTSLTPQNRTRLETAAELEARAYCSLDGGAARPMMRAAHAELLAVLHDGTDAGLDAGIGCGP